MQSYEHHIVQESLQARHPYLQDEFSSDIIPNQITIAVFDRTIEKFKEVLLQEGLEPTKCRDALKTLNELIHNQETADQMVDNDIIAITSALMRHKDKQVREQAALLISQFALHNRASPHLMEYSFKNLKEILEDEDQLVRDAAALVFQNLSINAAGRECIRDTASAEAMKQSFIKHSSKDHLQKTKGKYLILLLEAFVNLTREDFGIEPLLGSQNSHSAIAQFSNLLESVQSSEYAQLNLSQSDYKMICQLCLRVLGNMSINHQGKQECIDHKVISKSAWYIDEERPSSIYEDSLNASLVLMSCSIHLDGKKQIVNEVD